MIATRILPPAAFKKRKAELEARDGTKVTPELIAAAKRLERAVKMKARMRHGLVL